MPITSFNDYIASAKQIVEITKTATLTTVAANFGNVIAQAGTPGAGTLAGSNTANGVVPTSAVAGFPLIKSFAGVDGYISRVTFANSVACRLRIWDCLFKAGAYAFNAATVLASQPSYAARVPGGNDFRNTELWIEGVTAFTGNLSIAVTYTDQDGNAGQTTGTVATGIAPAVGRMVQIPLAAGDTGLQKVESVTATIATVGTFNVMVLRPLWEGNIRVANGGDIHDMFKTGLPVVFDTSALLLGVAADSTSSGAPSVLIELASK